VVGARALAIPAALWVMGGLAACDAKPPPGEEAGASGAELSSAAIPPYSDSLILLARTDSVSPTRLPLDWFDLLHPRFADRMAFPDPAEFPLAMEFMATVMRSEATRTGASEAGLDWLRRWDGTVRAYYAEARDGVLPFRRGEVLLLVIPASEVGGLAEEENVAVVPLESGALPRMTFPGGGSQANPDRRPAADPAPDWFSTWQVEVRGRSPGRRD
jgi:hypothetical protein